jgi:hypothetical protein
MISEQGPARPQHADDTPTEIFQAIKADQNSIPLPPPPPRPRPPEVSLPTRTRERRQLKLSAALAMVILIVLGVAAYEVTSGVGHKPHVAAVADTTVTKQTSAAATKQTSAATTPVSPSVSPAGSPTMASTSPPPSASPVAVVSQPLRPTGVTAVGPSGGAGEDPGAAARVIYGGTSAPWQTEWYATPEYGGLQTGTGLLIDMGRTATITGVRVTLGSEVGTDFQVRVGDSSSMSGLTTVATEAGVGGTVQVKLASPVQASYVLVWFTKLPPDGSGTYQLDVYNISVTGQP